MSTMGSEALCAVRCFLSSPSTGCPSEDMGLSCSACIRKLRGGQEGVCLPFHHSQGTNLILRGSPGESVGEQRMDCNFDVAAIGTSVWRA